MNGHAVSILTKVDERKTADCTTHRHEAQDTKRLVWSFSLLLVYVVLDMFYILRLVFAKRSLYCIFGVVCMN